MGWSGISPLSLLLIFFLAVLFLGTDKLGRFAKELGQALHAFKKGLQGPDDTDDPKA